jgi:hypothetical protein
LYARRFEKQARYFDEALSCYGRKNSALRRVLAGLWSEIILASSAQLLI